MGGEKVELKLWSSFLDLDKEWELFRFPRFLSEMHEFRPSVDVDRHNGDLIVSVELPGIDPAKDVEITVDGDVLVVKGEKSEEREVSEDDRYVHERRYGKFIRRIPLPEGVSADKVMASYDSGVLTVRVTLPEEKAVLEPRTIPVRAGTS
jgi:HSP20 family protein